MAEVQSSPRLCSRLGTRRDSPQTMERLLLCQDPPEQTTRNAPPPSANLLQQRRSQATKQEQSPSAAALTTDNCLRRPSPSPARMRANVRGSTRPISGQAAYIDGPPIHRHRPSATFAPLPRQRRSTNRRRHQYSPCPQHRSSPSTAQPRPRLVVPDCAPKTHILKVTRYGTVGIGKWLSTDTAASRRSCVGQRASHDSPPPPLSAPSTRAPRSSHPRERFHGTRRQLTPRCGFQRRMKGSSECSDDACGSATESSSGQAAYRGEATLAIAVPQLVCLREVRSGRRYRAQSGS